MSEQDQKPAGDAPAGTAGAGDTKTTPEGFVPKEQFTASQTEAIRLKKENDELRAKNPTSKSDLPEDKKKVFEYLSEYEKQKIEDAKKADEELKANLDKLHSIHGDFDDKKFLSIVDEYGVFNDDGNIKWEKGIDLYRKLGNQITKKPEIGARTQDKPLEAEKVEVRGKHIHELVAEGLRKFGIGGK